MSVDDLEQVAEALPNRNKYFMEWLDISNHSMKPLDFKVTVCNG